MKTPEKKLEYIRKWYRDNLEREQKKRRDYAREYRRTNPARRMLAGAKDRARRKGIPFGIQVDDIEIPELCPVFGVPMVVGTPYAPSLDRINHDLGYVKGNVQVISRKANTMKQDATLEELEKFADWLKSNI